MGPRVNYPAPPCPRCKLKGSYVRGTVYTEEQEIIRYRRCKICDFSWWTRQPVEANIDPALEVVSLPKKWKMKKSSPVKIVPVQSESCTPSQSSSA